MPSLPRLVNVVIELSRCCITSAITVRSLHCADVEQPQHAARVLAGLVQQLLPPRHIGALRARAVGHQRLQQPHRVGALAVAARARCGCPASGGSTR